MMRFITKNKVRLLRAGAVLLTLAVWQAAAWLMGEELLLPAPAAVLRRLTALVLEADFWRTVLFSFARITAGFLLAFLAGAGRFGAPLAPGRAPDFGKARLIANGARLLDYAGHHDEVLRRYARRTVRAAARALHAPPGLEAEALTAWLDRVGAARAIRAPT